MWNRSIHLPRLSRFALVGLLSTLVYAVVALVLGAVFENAAGQAPISLLAYAIAAIFSYIAHRLFTFASSGAYRSEIPRFVLLTLTGAGISFVIPVIVEYWLGLPILFSVAAVCIIIPLSNYFALDRWVFGDRDVKSR
jgi:putative flippase GtrA